jgi:hypothetical protein
MKKATPLGVAFVKMCKRVIQACHFGKSVTAAATAVTAVATATAVTTTATFAATTASAAAAVATTAAFATTTTSAAIATAAVTATTIATAVGAAETSRALFTGTSFIHHNGAACHGLTIQSVDGGLSLGIRAHFDKAETLGAAGFAVHHDLGRADSTEFRESVLQILVAHAVGQIAHVKFVAHERAPFKVTK